MLKTLQIGRYRGIESLELSGLQRLNLLVGPNGAGKTTVLESFVFLISGGQPELVPRLAAMRGLDLALDSPKSGRDLYWAPMFFNLDLSSLTRFAGVDGTGRELEVTMRIKQVDVRDVPIIDGRPDPFLLNAEGAQLVLRFSAPSIKNERRMILGEGAIRIDGASVRPGIPSALIAPHSHDPVDEAGDLARLQRTKQVSLVVEALQQIEPKIRGVEVGVAGGQPIIFCDLGLSELVPLSSLGGGTLRIMRLLLAISSAPNGVALIDEVETGLHHSAMSTAWAAIQTAAAEFNTQVVATTHSRECIQAAHRTLGDDGFQLIRIDQPEGKIRATEYTPQALSGALGFNMEVR
ncbi:MAG: AAA family ATPase [Acidobacteria bacterium]|nr:AAA family ATPase [Acidobacteriota bacterium]MYA45328.1 AAA family ATPase [Acidobacteriota bacterium]MYI39089.1 AAA family ATPase [Acidobacteriota bacterium]